MAKVVQRDGGQAGTADQAYELLVHLIGVQRRSVLLGEHQVVAIVVGGTPGEPFAGLLSAPGSKYLHRAIVQIDDAVLAVAGLRLRAVLGRTAEPLVFLRGAVADPGDLPPHDDPADPEIQIGPAQTAQLTPSQPAKGAQMVERVQLLPHDRVKPSPELLRFPGSNSRPGTDRTVREDGDVTWDLLGTHRCIQCRPKRGMDSLGGGGAEWPWHRNPLGLDGSSEALGFAQLVGSSRLGQALRVGGLGSVDRLGTL